MKIKCQLDATDEQMRAARKLDTQLSAPHHTDNLKTKAPNTTGSSHLYNTLELLMMGIMMPETCWASSKIYNKNHLLHLVGILFPHINDDARSKPHQIYCQLFTSLLNQVEKCWQACIITTATKWQCLNKTCSTISVSSFLSFRFNSAKLWVRRNNFTASNHVNATNGVTTHKCNLCVNIMTVTFVDEKAVREKTPK